ncbi:unnamed protein product [Rhodiola kirilowii]
MAALPSTDPDGGAVPILRLGYKHPPYAAMIKGAIAAENKSSGSSKQAISKHIKSAHSNLPDTHDALLDSNLKRLCQGGQIVRVKNSYKLSASETGSQMSRSSTGSQLVSIEHDQSFPIQVPFAEPKAPDESDVNEVDSISKKPRRSVKTQKGKAFTHKAGNGGRLGPIQPHWVVSYNHVQSKLQFVQEKMKRILDEVKPYLVDEIARSGRLADAVKELDQISSMNILAFPLQADEAQEQGGTAEPPHLKAQHLALALPKSKPSSQRRLSPSKVQCSSSSFPLPKSISKNQPHTASQSLQKVRPPQQQLVRQIQQQSSIQQNQLSLQAQQEQFLQPHQPALQQPLMQHHNKGPFQQLHYQQAFHFQPCDRVAQPYQLVLQHRPQSHQLQPKQQ